MSYQVLARKWRPRRFEDLLGQEHVVRALGNGLDADRIHHAFLFTGTRGVGKTTIARILAKSLNCERGVSSSPCGECSACNEIDEGRFVDLVEVDAASRTKVDETRELLENVQYAPARGRYKVYLIDEVHMFSEKSFNALLKTLEEPPPHVKFLLATTDPQKLPVTVLSRCLQFNLKALPEPLIAGHLEKITGAEGVEAEPAALRLIAHAAHGSVRDALSLLDQAIADGAGSLEAAQVGAMLGVIDTRHVFALLDALAAADGAALLREVEAMAERSPAWGDVLDELISVLQRIAVAQVVPESVDADDIDAGEIARCAQTFSPEDVQLFYQVALIGRRDLGMSPDPRGGLEMVLLRMLAFRPAEGGAEPVRGAGGASRPASPSAAAKAPPEDGGAKPGASLAGADDWTGMIEAMRLTGMARELAVNCHLAERDAGRVVLKLPPANAQIRNARAEARIEQALAEHLGGPVRLVIEVEAPEAETPAAARRREQAERRAAAVESIRDDENVQALCDAFDAEIEDDSIQPL